ncbi:PEP-CTERM/exosortase system-associated acyltransferase [Parahaliea sp. F7430]|uniref:PEP-CTERM/exosortase system-associated acyltransferase n=1 Tax=Sediminihaliea albiluteola TaxID=2758564 RepID=A0A7W2YJW9_9GAMM|nr:PEP-CTERM/exosortase system-associated acyltransferase [Sediminihaliea albiluteola]MBA6412728.1 PEP-CTERM/exosortase system-associated acyltransferase [Sediminihaliea albiluteola]
MSEGKTLLVDDFRRFFAVSIASSAEDIQRCFHIRYRVYCEEFGYEPKSRFADEFESDSFDSASHHCLITHRSTGRAAGCVRLVETTPGRPLPLETFCGQALDASALALLDDNRNRSCEISRLAVDSDFRRRAGEDQTRFGEPSGIDYSLREKRSFSLIAVAAYLSATALAELTGRNRVFAMMEPFLPRLLSRSGIHFVAAGSEIDYHGWRAPYTIDSADVVAHMAPELSALYQAIHADFSESWSASKLLKERAELESLRRQPRLGLQALFGTWGLSHA